jgi:hypothetical protein
MGPDETVKIVWSTDMTIEKWHNSDDYDAGKAPDVVETFDIPPSTDTSTGV